jgi:hypothetical protein
MFWDDIKAAANDEANAEELAAIGGIEAVESAIKEAVSSEALAAQDALSVFLGLYSTKAKTVEKIGQIAEEVNASKAIGKIGDAKILYGRGNSLETYYAQVGEWIAYIDTNTIYEVDNSWLFLSDTIYEKMKTLRQKAQVKEDADCFYVAKTIDELEIEHSDKDRLFRFGAHGWAIDDKDLYCIAHGRGSICTYKRSSDFERQQCKVQE